MFLFRKGIGKLKNLSSYEKDKIVNNLPPTIECDVQIRYESGVDESFNEYDL